MRTTLKLIMCMALFICLVVQPAMAKDVYEFKISTDSLGNHPRNVALAEFLKELSNRSNGRLKGKLFHSAQLYNDKAVPKALTLGTLDMGLPGDWFLTTYDINVNIAALPMFYGQPPEATLKLMDGEYGKLIAKSIENKTKAKVLGRFYLSGAIQTFTVSKEIKKIEDFKGLKIRTPGSPINIMRIKAFGANPISIPWADTAMALMQGTIDGLQTNYKAAEGGKLDDAGIKFALKENIQISFYLPMVSKRFWSSLPDDLKKILVDVWNESVDDQRDLAFKLHDEAELILEKRGVKFYRPSAAQLAEWREHIMPAQTPFVEKMGIDKNFVDMAKKELGM